MTLSRRFIISVALAGAFVFPATVFAQPTQQECFQPGYGNIACLPYFLKNIINGFLAFAGVVAVILICLSGIRMIVSSGDPGKIEQAKKSLNFAIIGFVIILLSFVIVNVVAYVTGAKLF